MKKPLALLLDTLIAKAPEEDKGAIALQVQIESQAYAGSVMHSKEHEGLYEMVVVDPNQRIAVSIFFAPESLSAVFVPKTDQKPSERRIVMPGAH